MKAPLIHIGYHKTATSWLQIHLFGRADRGFFPLAPEGAEQGKHSAKYLARLFFRDSDNKLLSPFLDRTEEIQNFVSRLNIPLNKVPVISSERLCGTPHGGGFDAPIVAHRIYKAFPHAKILIVLREQAEAVVSTYYLHLKSGACDSFDDFLNREYDGRMPVFSSEHFCYHRLIDLYQSLFGPSNVRTMLYEDFKNRPREFIKEISIFSGAEIPENLDFEKRENENRERYILELTRNLNMLRVKHSLNSYSPFACSLNRRIIDLVRKQISFFPLSKKQQAVFEGHKIKVLEKFGSKFSESNRISCSLTGLDLVGHGYV